MFQREDSGITLIVGGWAWERKGFKKRREGI